MSHNASSTCGSKKLDKMSQSSFVTASQSLYDQCSMLDFTRWLICNQISDTRGEMHLLYILRPCLNRRPLRSVQSKKWGQKQALHIPNRKCSGLRRLIENTWVHVQPPPLHKLFLFRPILTRYIQDIKPWQMYFSLYTLQMHQYGISIRQTTILMLQPINQMANI